MVSFTKLFKLIGLNTGQLLNIKNTANTVNLDYRTVMRYIEILTMTFQISILHPWLSNTKKRLVKTPKVYFNDTGFASFYMGINNFDNLKTNNNYGALLETWLWSEIRKQIALEIGISSYFYRSHIGKEVDFVLEKVMHFGNRV